MSALTMYHQRKYCEGTSVSAFALAAFNNEAAFNDDS